MIGSSPVKLFSGPDVAPDPGKAESREKHQQRTAPENGALPGFGKRAGTDRGDKSGADGRGKYGEQACRGGVDREVNAAFFFQNGLYLKVE